MAWGDVAMVVFACTMANHLGLIEAVERTVGFRLPIVNCCKCASFWCVMAYCGLHGFYGDSVGSIATSFLAAYAAVWLELCLGFTDVLYNKAYGRIYDEATLAEADRDTGGASAEGAGGTEGTMPEVRIKTK